MSSGPSLFSRREAGALAGGLVIMAMIPENPVVGGTVLRRQAIQSPNFVAGSTGWTINQDGSAEFDNVVIRNGQIISGTALFYSGVPAAGNLVASVAAAAGTDSFGNHYLSGFGSYSGGVAVSVSALNVNTDLTFWTGSLAAGWTQNGGIGLGGAADTNIYAGAGGTIHAEQILSALAGLTVVAGITTDTEVISSAQANVVMLDITNTTAGAASPLERITTAAAGDTWLSTRVAGDTIARFRLSTTAGGLARIDFGPGNAAVDTDLYRAAAAILQTDGEFDALRLKAIAAAVGNQAVDVHVTGDTNPRLQVLGNGNVTWGPGNAANDITLSRLAANSLGVSTADLAVDTVGRGLQVKEGTNAKQGTAILAAGTVTVANTAVTANSRIMLTAQNLGTVTTPSALCVSARTAGTSFTIKASQATDTSTVAYEIFEPAP